MLTCRVTCCYYVVMLKFIVFVLFTTIFMVAGLIQASLVFGADGDVSSKSQFGAVASIQLVHSHPVLIKTAH